MIRLIVSYWLVHLVILKLIFCVLVLCIPEFQRFIIFLFSWNTFQQQQQKKNNRTLRLHWMTFVFQLNFPKVHTNKHKTEKNGKSGCKQHESHLKTNRFYLWILADTEWVVLTTGIQRLTSSRKNEFFLEWNFFFLFLSMVPEFLF